MLLHCQKEILFSPQKKTSNILLLLFSFLLLSKHCCIVLCPGSSSSSGSSNSSSVIWKKEEKRKKKRNTFCLSLLYTLMVYPTGENRIGDRREGCEKGVEGISIGFILSWGSVRSHTPKGKRRRRNRRKPNAFPFSHSFYLLLYI